MLLSIIVQYFKMIITFYFIPSIWFNMLLFSWFWPNDHAHIPVFSNKNRGNMSSNCFSWNQLIIWGKKSIIIHCIFINFNIWGLTSLIYETLSHSAFIIYFCEAIITKILNKYNYIDEGITFYLESNLAKYQKKLFLCILPKNFIIKNLWDENN